MTNETTSTTPPARRPSAEAKKATSIPAGLLTDEQLDGHACVVCGADYSRVDVASVPAGMVDGGQVFACEPCVRPAEAAPVSATPYEPSEEDERQLCAVYERWGLDGLHALGDVLEAALHGRVTWDQIDQAQERRTGGGPVELARLLGLRS